MGEINLLIILGNSEWWIDINTYTKIKNMDII